MLDAIIGKLRSPHYGQLTLDARSGKLVMTFTAQSEGGLKTNFEKTYDSPLITGQAVMDLLSWLRSTAKTFFGSEAGGF